MFVPYTCLALCMGWEYGIGLSSDAFLRPKNREYGLRLLSLILASQSDEEQVTKEKKIETVPRMIP